MRRALIRIPIFLAIVAAIAGCQTAAQRKAIANSAATQWEAAEAIRRGANVVGPCDVIQANASAIARSAGYQYPAPRPAAASAAKAK